MKGTHLTLEERKFIQHGLEEGVSKAKIALELGKSPSTVSKEVKKHRTLKLTSAYGRGSRYFCENAGTLKQCFGCKKKCENFLNQEKNPYATMVLGMRITWSSRLQILTFLPLKWIQSLMLLRGHTFRPLSLKMHLL